MTQAGGSRARDGRAWLAMTHCATGKYDVTWQTSDVNPCPYGFGPVKFPILKDVVGRRSKTPTWARAYPHHVGLCEYRPAR